MIARLSQSVSLNARGNERTEAAQPRRDRNGQISPGRTCFARELICGKLKAFDLRETGAQFGNGDTGMLRREMSPFVPVLP